MEAGTLQMLTAVCDTPMDACVSQRGLEWAEVRLRPKYDTEQGSLSNRGLALQ